MSFESTNNKIYAVLKQYFGYDTLREGQQPLIESLLAGRDALGVMPTGAGKSLCYQIPALLLDGVTIVVSPLISLMTDQVKALNLAGVHAAYINSMLTESQTALALSYASQGRYSIIYVAPERLLTPRFLQFACSTRIALLAVDEAHCISQWGQDFRPSYRQIADFLNQLPERPAVAAFTATATEQVKTDIVKQLGLRQPTEVMTGFDRPNLLFRVITKKGGRETDNSVINYVKRHEGESGIIYCATRKNVDKVYDLLRQHGILAGRYHAGLEMEERRQCQEDFTYDRVQVIVATNAFGMGIDKSNVRYVLHYNMPQSMEYYYQEAGRAGRDGEEAECVLFFSRQDIMINRRLIDFKSGSDGMTSEEVRQMHRSDGKRLNQMIEYCETDECLRQYILDYFGDKRPCTCGKCSNCVVIEEADEELYVGTGKKKASSVLLELDEQLRPLFEKLRQLRAELARKQGMPPYVVCSDKTLKELCVQLPKNTAELLAVNGMGERKAAQYGEALLSAIAEYLQEYAIDPVMRPKPEKAAPQKKTLPPFSVTEDALAELELPEIFRLKDLTAQLNELRDPDTKKITAVFLNTLLLERGYLIETEADGKKEKRVTELGKAVGMTETERTGKDGTYFAITHSRESGQVIVAALREWMQQD